MLRAVRAGWSISSALDLVRGILCATMLASSAACSSWFKKEEQLAGIAKDWSLTIRASQVIPIYPLKEDLQVGDIFVTRTSIDKEIEMYRKRGFLPLEEQISRIRPSYLDFYPNGIYGVKDGANPPGHWQFPTSAPALTTSGTSTGAGAGNQGSSRDDDSSRKHSATTNWGQAPRAAFPSYSYKVDRTGGASFAFPLQGVPIGLSILGASSAAGEVSLSDAYTYGIDTKTLRSDVEKWAKDNQEFLRDNYGPIAVPDLESGDALTFFMRRPKKFKREYRWLRAVSRVYLIGGIDVSVYDTSQFGAEARARNPSALGLLKPTTNPAQYDAVVTTLNENIARSTTRPATMPSDAVAAVKVVALTERSVSLRQTFARPLVIGYLALDWPVFEDGSLGTPVSTDLNMFGVKTFTAAQVLQHWYEKDKGGERKAQIERWLQTQWNSDRQRPYLVATSMPAMPTAEDFVEAPKFERLRQRFIVEELARP